MSFGERLKTLRESKNLLQKDLANELGLNQKTISNYEKGDRQPDFGTLEKIAVFFDVSTDYLLGRTDNPTFIPSNKSTTFSERIKEVRTKSSLTHEELANKMNLPISTILSWENNKVVPDTFTLAGLSKLLNTSIDYLIGLVDDKKETVINVQPPIIKFDKDLTMNMYNKTLEFHNYLKKTKFFESFSEAIEAIDTYDSIVTFDNLYTEAISEADIPKDFKELSIFSNRLKFAKGLLLAMKIIKTIENLKNLTETEKTILERYADFLFSKYLSDFNNSIDEITSFDSYQVFSNLKKHLIDKDNKKE